ncbi:MAG: response regulator transcription factor [Planctomycetota bacterium]
MKRLRILVAEDDPATRSALVEVLRGDGHEVRDADDGLRARQILETTSPDLVCLDLMMPRVSGFELCRHIRTHHPDMAVLMITAKSDEVDRVVGLELGADDYIVKPFGIKEVLARVHAVARRCVRDFENAAPASASMRGTPFDFGDWEIRPAELKGYDAKGVVPLTRREVALLGCLASRVGEVVTRAELWSAGWGRTPMTHSRTLDQTISTLRKRIEPNPAKPRWIKTVYGVGYRYEMCDTGD